MTKTRLSSTKPPDALTELWSSCDDATSLPCSCFYTCLSHTTEVSLCLSSQNGTQATLWTNSTLGAIAADEPVTKVSATVTLAPPTTRASSTTQDVATLPPATVRQSSSITTGYGAASTPAPPTLPPSTDEPIPVDTSSSSTPMPTSETLPPAPPAENSTSYEPIPAPMPTTTAARPGTPPTTTAQSDSFDVLFNTAETSAPPSPAPISSESPQVSVDGQSQPPTSSVPTQAMHTAVSTTVTPGPVESTVVPDGADDENGGDLSMMTATTASTHMLTVVQTRTVTEIVSTKSIIHSVVTTSSPALPSVQRPSPSASSSLSFFVLTPDQAMDSSIGTPSAPSSLQKPSITYTLAPPSTRPNVSVPSNLPTSTDNLVQSSISELCSTDPENSTCMALSMILSASANDESVIATLEITTPTSSPTTLPRPTTTGLLTPVQTPSPTCFGNSGTCFCLTIGTETSCTLRTTFSIGTLTDLRTASSTISTPSPTNTNGTVPVTTTEHSPVPVIPLVIGILGPFLLVLLLIGLFSSWRKVSPTSYSRYASHCPLHQTYYGITAVLKRWKLTRKRNKSLRSGAARAWSGFTQPGSDGYVGLGGHSSGDEKYEAHEMSRPGTAASNYTNVKSSVRDKSHGNAYAATTTATWNATGTDTDSQNKRNSLACSWLSSWSSNQQSRLHELQRRYNAEQANSNADVLRRYELERSRRVRDFGVGGLSIDESRADAEVGTVPSKVRGLGMNGVSGVGKAWTISNGAATSPGLATGTTAALMSGGLPEALPKRPSTSSAKAKSIFTRRSTHKTAKISHPHLDHTTAVSSLPEQASTTPVAIDGPERRDSWVQHWYDLGSDMPNPRRVGFDNRPNSPSGPIGPSSPGAKPRNAMDVPRQTLRQMQDQLQDELHVRGHGHEDADAITPAPAGVHPAFRNEIGHNADAGNERGNGSKSGKWSSSPTSTAVSEKGAWI